MPQNLIKDVQAVLEDISSRVDQIVQETNLHCPTGCGACCHSPDIEAMPVEMLPLAELAISQGITTKGTLCPFFQPHQLTNLKGRCGAYALRPSICRIFPYGTTKDKTGTVRWNKCSKMPESKEVEKTKTTILEGKTLNYTLAKQELQDLQPELSETMPINKALIGAMNYIKAKTCYNTKCN